MKKCWMVIKEALFGKTRKIGHSTSSFVLLREFVRLTNYFCGRSGYILISKSLDSDDTSCL